MEDTHAGGTAGILENALALAGAGRLDNAARARLWALVAGGVISGGTAHALVEIDVQARGRSGKAGNGGSAALKAAKREEIRLTWANSVPWSIRGRLSLPLATWAVLGMLIARAGCPGGCPGEEWRAELSLTEMQRRLGGAGRKTVVGAVSRLERAGVRPRHPAPAEPEILRGQRLYPRAPGGRPGRPRGRRGGRKRRPRPPEGGGETGLSLSRRPSGRFQGAGAALPSPKGQKTGPRRASYPCCWEFTRFQQFTQGHS